MVKIFYIRFIFLIVLIFTGIILAATIMEQSTSIENSFTNNTEANSYRKATFAGGCFWCMESPFEAKSGIIEVLTGYSGGSSPNPSYKLVSSGKTDYKEVVQITFDSELISYEELLEIFWKQIDPTDPNGQFTDRGAQYTTAIFYHNQEQKLLAKRSKERLKQKKIFEKQIVTKIIPYKNFYPAEEYHQNYYQKMPLYYNHYKELSGRAFFLRNTWTKMSLHTPNTNKTTNHKYSKVDLAKNKKKLSKLQYEVTQENGTERPFHNEYWDNKKSGIYVDIVSGEPLFSSLDQFSSGTGWPSFTKPLVAENIYEKKDLTHGVERTEVRSIYANSHLGHVFNDGPLPSGLRYCINSAALRFIPQEKLKAEGYETFLSLFKK